VTFRHQRKRYRIEGNWRTLLELILRGRCGLLLRALSASTGGWSLRGGTSSARQCRDSRTSATLGIGSGNQKYDQHHRITFHGTLLLLTHHRVVAGSILR